MKVFLVIAYISTFGEVKITKHEMPSYAECLTAATKQFKQITAGSSRVWCHKAIRANAN